MMMFIRLYRALPLIIGLAVLAGVLYMVFTYRYSPEKAKDILSRMFRIICGALTVFFTLASLYALLEQNDDVFEFFACLDAAAIFFLLLTLFCRWRFLKKNPQYKERPMRAKRHRRKP